jgi:calcium binding protein 39
MFGEGIGTANDSSKENALAITKEACSIGLIGDLVENLNELDFEAKRDAVQVFGAMVRIEGPDPGRFPGANYIIQNNGLLEILFDGYDDSEIALDCGEMLRDCIRHEKIADMVLNSAIFEEMFDKVELSNFEIASDAFNTFKDLITRHKTLVSLFLKPTEEEIPEGEEDTSNFTFFFQKYNKLLESENYVTRRQSIKLLGELLCEKKNGLIMKKYVASVEDLALIMRLLRDDSRSIQFEAFHVFKIFVANPKKSSDVHRLLFNNKDKLQRYLAEFQLDREDEQFKEERDVIISTIAKLKDPDAAE